MSRLHFSIVINAPKEHVWDVMLGDATYRQWTVPFNPGSYFQGTWDQGSEIRFLGPNPEGGGEGGMFSRIRENRLHEFVSIEHLGFIKDGVIDTTSDEVKQWVPAFENYTFQEKDGGTEVLVDIDLPDAYKAMFEDLWPKALLALKELSEK
jgi:hypothetical protein